MPSNISSLYLKLIVLVRFSYVFAQTTSSGLSTWQILVMIGGGAGLVIAGGTYFFYRLFRSPDSSCYRFKCLSNNSVEQFNNDNDEQHENYPPPKMEGDTSPSQAWGWGDQPVPYNRPDSGAGYHTPPPVAEVQKPEERRPHVMISYESTVKSQVFDFRQTLREKGYRVWVNMDNGPQGESKNEHTATAIENAAVVVPVLTTPYQESEVCRREVEYADKIKKPLVPVRMEKKFKPGGWLGFLLGNTLFHDLSNPSTYDGQIENFLEGIEHLGGAALMDEDERAKWEYEY